MFGASRIRIGTTGREAQIDGGSGGGADAAERQVGGGPDFRAACVGAEDGSANVVGADEIDHAAFDDGEARAVAFESNGWVKPPDNSGTS